MKEPLTPKKLEKDHSTGDLSKENAAEILISLIESSEDSEIRVESIKVLEKIDCQNKNNFKIFENIDFNINVNLNIIFRIFKTHISLSFL